MNKASAVIAILIWGLASHTASRAQGRASGLVQWPAASVERPLTLPEGLGQWKAWSFYSNQQNWSWFPLGFEQGISDAFTLVWLPIPVEARVRLFSDAERQHQLALTVNILGAVTSQTTNFNWSPFVALDYRLRPGVESRPWIVDFRLMAMLELRREAQPVAGTFALEIQPRIQPWSWIWIAAGPSFWLEAAAPRSFYWGSTPNDGQSLRVPLSASLGFSVFNRFDFENRLVWLRFGFPQGFSQLQWATSIAFWF